MNNRIMVRGALLVALALILQGIRIVLPLPPLASTFLIGTLVHMMLATTFWQCGAAPAYLLSLLLPVTAYIQGQLLLPLLIPVVWVGNMLFVYLLNSASGIMQLVFPPLMKAAVMYAGAHLVIIFLQLPQGALVQGILFGMSVPQAVTGALGILLAQRLARLLP